MRRVLLLAVAAALLVTGCGGDDGATAEVRVYFLRDGKVWPFAREVEQASVGDAFAALTDGPTEQEAAELGVTTGMRDGDAVLSEAGLAQLVFTMTQFATAEYVDLGESTYSRADFEDLTPSVLVESPLPFDEVQTPLRVTGTANTFEANFQYELLDAGGNVVDENFVTATSGTGTRGTFEFTTADVDNVATLVVFENSAEDGSRMNEVEIPLTVAP